MTQQCVLDLDLDFFLSDCCPLAQPGMRPDDHSAAPWSEQTVRHFLEHNCGLSKSRPVPGRIFETHDMALDFWKEQLDTGALKAPFRVVHVDAHSDLGIAPPRAAYVENTVLCQMPNARVNLPRYRRESQLTEANYLLFALAFRWIGRLDNVRNPMSRRDIPAELIQTTQEGNIIRLRQAFPQLFQALHGPEPGIPFHSYNNHESFCLDSPCSFVSLAISPRYTPASADHLIQIIREYCI